MEKTISCPTKKLLAICPHCNRDTNVMLQIRYKINGQLITNWLCPECYYSIIKDNQMTNLKIMHGDGGKYEEEHKEIEE